MKIGITGADSTGKSTLIATIVPILSMQYKVKVLSIGDIARSSPFPLIEKQTTESSRWILEAVKSSELTALTATDILICDRTALDIWIFSEISTIKRKITESGFDSFQDEIHAWLKTYQIIYYSIIDPKIPVSIPNLPNLNFHIRNQFEEVLLTSIKMFEETTTYLRLPNNTDTRVEFVISTINTLLKP